VAVTKPAPENTLLVRIDLGVNMKHNLEAAAEKSLQVAQQKWGLNLPSADIDRILHHSRAQLLRHVSDDARTEWDGGRVVVVAGDERAMKVTTPMDLALAELLLERQSAQGERPAETGGEN